MSLDCLCPPFGGAPNTTLFYYQFGIKFHCNDHIYVWASLPFEFTSCFGFTDDIRYRLSQLNNWVALDARIPALMSAWLFNHINDRLCAIQESNSEIFPPRHYTAPAAHIQAFVKGTIGTHIPDKHHWIKA
jgi:hypothetical protein